MEVASLGLALLAGLLSTLSPCVLPLLPIVLGAAVGEHRFGPAALAAGLALAYVAVGLLVATIGFSLGLDFDTFRYVAAAMLVAIGLVLMLPPLQARFALAAAPVGNWTQQHFGGFSTAGPGGQFALGLLLGAAWSPCVGPTLGAASLLAAQGRNFGEVATVMAIFGVGAALPLIVLGTLSRGALMRWRGHILAAGSGLKVALGALLAAAGILILSGLDKRLEAILANLSPQWLTDLTTRF
ncbi:MAG: sulfite exporter TauE/SafE family protein [Proteobacteria bacterium]|nr:sulfite exporter TauE/SafE family protein [Pseudomonadota bacterium]